MSRESSIDYPAIVREALRPVVRQVLELAAEEGLPGEHHLYLTFRTTVPGVEMPANLWRSHPEEMTIVLQHQFWNLEVREHEFSVSLRFGGVPCDLTVPFEALTSFVDPAAKFGLNFESKGEAASEDEPQDSDEEKGPSETKSLPGSVVSLDDFRKK